ncbi:hypothetical protein BDQ17DRAFT_1441224 [Cyathus striatus]|nr:hypothetical protein BDQ17DRAFT_1441224 [Cyathus striatus]
MAPSADSVDSSGEIEHCEEPTKRKKANALPTAGPTTDEDDPDFNVSDSGESTDHEQDCMPTNKEIAQSLPAKMIPDVGKGSGKQKKRHINVQVVEDLDSTTNISHRNIAPSASIILEDATGPSEKFKMTGNPIYFFYKDSTINSKNSVGNLGDKHYKCYHGGQRVLTITKAMRCSLNGLIGNLKTANKIIEGITQEEIDIASGKIALSESNAAGFLEQLEKQSENIQKAFTKQEEHSKGPWDQEKFEQLLAGWVVTCDQPFEEVERPEFRRLLEYVFRGTSIKIPGRYALKWHIIKLCEEGVEGLKLEFSVGI